MKNPWLELPGIIPFVLKEDLPIIQRFNTRFSPTHPVYIHTEGLPMPVLGRPESPVILLSLNPGFTEADIDNPAFEELATEEIQFHREAPIKNLRHEHLDYPFYLLDPKVKDAPGYGWWTGKLKHLIAEFGQKFVANNVLCVEFFPYPSKRYGYCEILPSQRYSFYLVKEAMRRNAVIVGMRSLRLWLSQVPELEKYPNFFALNNPQNPAVSPNNCPPDGYQKLQRELKRVSQI
jgi:hypothetical protein